MTLRPAGVICYTSAERFFLSEGRISARCSLDFPHSRAVDRGLTHSICGKRDFCTGFIILRCHFFPLCSISGTFMDKYSFNDLLHAPMFFISVFWTFWAAFMTSPFGDLVVFNSSDPNQIINLRAGCSSVSVLEALRQPLCRHPFTGCYLCPLSFFPPFFLK